MIIRKLRNICMNFFSPNKVAKFLGVKFGDNCKFGKHCNFGSEPYLITIGNNLYTSSNVQFLNHDGAVNVLRNINSNYRNIDLFAPITIGNNVFLGYRTTILPGTVIGDNVIIGACSLVRGNIKSNGVYGGVPAKYICSLDDYEKKVKNNVLYTKNLNSKEKEKIIRNYFKNVNK